MNEQIYQKLENNYKELKYQLKLQFKYKSFDSSNLEAFYLEIQKQIPKLTNESPEDLQNYFSFIGISKQLIFDSIGEGNQELFDKTLIQIFEESKTILEKY